MVNPLVSKLKGKGKQTVKITHEELGECEFTLRPISSLDLLEQSEILEAMPDSPKDLDPAKLDDKTYENLKTAIVPLMKRFIPMCCIDPKITTDPNDPSTEDPESNVVYIGTLPLDLLSQLFAELLRISGLSKQAEEDRKNLPELQSSSQ